MEQQQQEFSLSSLNASTQQSQQPLRNSSLRPRIFSELETATQPFLSLPEEQLEALIRTRRRPRRSSSEEDTSNLESSNPIFFMFHNSNNSNSIPNRETLSILQSTSINPTSQQQQQQQQQHLYYHFQTTLLNRNFYSGCPPLFKGCIFHIQSISDLFPSPTTSSHASTIQLYENLRTELIQYLEQFLGCTIIKQSSFVQYQNYITHFICFYQTGNEFEMWEHNSPHKITNLQWIEDCILLKQYIPYKNSIIYYPIRNRTGIPEMKNLVISVTGFIGEERNQLKFLIKSCGAVYSGALCKRTNTHLICSTSGTENEKFKRSIEWDIIVVQKQWLLDCIETWSRIEEKNYSPTIIIKKNHSLVF